ncbi:penicillin-binding protein 1A [Moraxella marmotae]|uniref:penicillin-binding protein 1A n=1 Tax=Moraxella marmotae TaxID=3344520 RepID=UPI0035F305C4
MSNNSFSASLIAIIAKILLAILALLAILILAFPIGFYGMAMYLEPTLPNIKNIDNVKFEMPLQIYTADNKLIGQYGSRYSLPVTFEEIPPHMIHAFLAAEDDTFFQHSGISVKGMGRALTEVVTDNESQTGGSTITMQVAKNYFLSPERTIDRKLTELFIARKIENELTKNQILTLYVNKIYLGENAYGIQAAARRYYSKPLQELSIAQMAMIAGLPKAPSAYNPVVNPERAMERRNWILGRMFEEGFISAAERDAAIAEPINLNLYREKLDMNMPYLAEMARSSLVERYGEAVMDSGWRVQTTVDSQSQLAADKALVGGLRSYDRRHGWRGVEAEEGELAGRKNFDNIYPAKVTKVSNNGFEAELQSGEKVNIGWSGMSWARRYYSANHVGGGYSNAHQMVKVGNIVRISPLNEAKTAWKMESIPKVQGALISLDPENGALRAVVGGFHFNHSKFNRATQGYRQPGSIIKPFVYSSALESGKHTPDSMVSDAAIRVGSWRPKNADGRYTGNMTLRRALALSRNTPAIRLLRSAGIDETRHLMNAMGGLEMERMPSTLALALGAAEVTPLQMATGFSTIANGGHRIQPYFVERIYNFHNDVIYQANPLQACALCFNEHLQAKNAKLAEEFEAQKAQATEQPAAGTPAGDRLNPKAAPQYIAATQAPRVLSQETSYNISNMMREVITSGTARRARALGRGDVGGKTGTTNLAKDAWFAGFHPTQVAVVWVGFDTPSPLGAHEFGGVAALPIWVDFMRHELRGRPNQWVSKEDRSKAVKSTQKVIDLKD